MTALDQSAVGRVAHQRVVAVPAQPGRNGRARDPRTDRAGVRVRSDAGAESDEAEPAGTDLGSIVVALVRHRRAQSRHPLPGAARRPRLAARRPRRGGPVDADRHRDRNRGRSHRGLSRRGAHAAHRLVARASRPAVPRRRRVDRHGRPGSVRITRSRGRVGDHGHPVAVALGTGRAGGAERDVECARARVRGRGRSDERLTIVDRAAPHRAQRRRHDHRVGDARSRAGHPRGEHPVVPRPRHPTADAELGQPPVERDLEHRGALVAHGVPRRGDLPDRARGRPRRRWAPGRVRSTAKPRA